MCHRYEAMASFGRELMEGIGAREGRGGGDQVTGLMDIRWHTEPQWFIEEALCNEDEG